MRLLDTATLELCEFFAPNIPPYAILSHTWTDEEIDFQHISTLDTLTEDAKQQEGFLKIQNVCHLAVEHDLAYAWVDTCCIDKSSSAELTESINSMYQFYAAAARCYVFLEDLASDDVALAGLPGCRWFTRGWTLQELLAPKRPEFVLFYDNTWKCRGSKLDFLKEISDATGISTEVLLGKTALSKCSVAERMSWAARRETTRIEDRAYSLLGIFHVNMPMLYGEGKNSFRRLQEEIIKRNNDLTILAWESPKTGNENDVRLFAESPSAFANNYGIKKFTDDFVSFPMTNQGLLISGETPLQVVMVKAPDGSKRRMYALFLGESAKHTRKGRHPDGGIYLQKVGPKLFYRDLTLPLAGFGENHVEIIHTLEDVADFYILTEPSTDVSKMSFSNNSLHIPTSPRFGLDKTIPEELWDVTDQVFLKPKPYKWAKYPMVIALQFTTQILDTNISFIVLCDYRGDYESRYEETTPSCKVFWKGDHPRGEALIFHGGHRRKSILWPQLEIDSPEILRLSNKAEKKIADQVISISASFCKGSVEGKKEKEELFTLNIELKQNLYADNASEETLLSEEISQSNEELKSENPS